MVAPFSIKRPISLPFFGYAIKGLNENRRLCADFWPDFREIRLIVRLQGSKPQMGAFYPGCDRINLVLRWLFTADVIRGRLVDAFEHAFEAR